MRPGLFVTGLVLVVGGGVLTGVSAFGGAGTGKVELVLLNKPTLITAAYKVYGNPEAVAGKYWAGKLTLSNTGDGPLSDVQVSYQIPGYVSWTTPQVYQEVLPGQTIVVPFYPKLPATVTATTSMTPATLEMKLGYDDGSGPKSRVEHRDFQLRGVREIEYSSLPQSEILTFYDMNDNSELNAAWVTEEDPAVRTFYTKVSELAGGFGTMGNFKDIEQLARSTYNYMVALGMTYSGTKGLAEKKGDEYVLVQSMRLPRDIIYGNSGLCVELTQLWCSIAINAGAGCYIVIIPGHAFPVIQASDGSLLAIESTGIGGAFEGGNLGSAASFEDAVKIASQNFQKVSNNETESVVVDVLAMRNQGIRPPELSDVERTALLKTLDDRLAQHQAARGQPNQPNPRGDTPQPQGGDAIAGNSWQDPRGRLGLTYPSTWLQNTQLVLQLQQVLPGYSLAVVNPANQIGVDVVFFEGVNDANVVINTLAATFRKLGASVQIGQQAQDQLGGRASVNVTFLLTGGSNGPVAGLTSVVNVPGGMAAVSFGGPQANLQGAANELQLIANSVRIGN